MAKAIGIDIGSKSLKILELENSSGKFSINQFFNIEVPFGNDEDNSPDLIVEPIKNIFTDYHLDKDSVVVSVPTQECILREITVEFDQDEHIKKIIKYEAEKYLQSYAIEDVIIDYRILSSKNGKSKLFLAAVPKHIIAQRLELLSLCEIDPIIINLDIVSLINVTRFCSEIDDKNTVALIDFGAGSTKIIVLQNGELRHVRAIRLGASFVDRQEESPKPDIEEISESSDEIDWDIENELIVSLPVPDGMNFDRMVLVKKDQSLGEKSEHDKKEELFERLIKEIKRTMLTMNLEDGIDIICLSGGGAQLAGIEDKMEKSLRIPTIILDYSERIEAGGDFTKDVMVSAPVSLGLSLALIDNNSQNMNFRKEEFSYTNRFELIKMPLAVMITCLCLLFFSLSFQVQKSRRTYENQYISLVEQAKLIWDRNFAKEGPLPGKKFDKIYRLYEKVRDFAEEGGDELPVAPNGFNRLNILLTKFSDVRSSYYITIDKISLDTNECLIEGEVENEEILDHLKRHIREIKKEVDSLKVRVLETTKNTNPSDKALKRRYKFQIGFKRTGYEEE